MPELRQLRTFVAVAEELSFTRAAERLHLGQQAVSKSIGQLERELGVELLERTTREVRLTAAGETLLHDARELLALADDAFERTRETGAALSGTVRVGVSPAVGPDDRHEVVRVLRAGAPELSVSLHEVRPGEMAQLLRGREVDLVLARAAGTDDVALDSAALRPTPMVLCVPAGHRLAAAASTTGAPVAIAQLDGERLLTWSPRGTPYTELLLRRLAAGGATVSHVEAHVTGGAAALTELAQAGAIALMPAGTVPPAPDVVALELVEEVTLPLVLLWPAGRPSAAVRRLRAGMTAGF